MNLRFYHYAKTLAASFSADQQFSLCPPSPGFWLWRRRLEAVQHEIHQRLPGLEAQVTGQGADVVEQALSRGQLLAQEPVFVVHPLQYGVGQKSQDDEAGQQGRQVLLAVAKVVREVVALGLQRVVVLVFDLPAAASCRDDLGDVTVVQRQAGREGVAVPHLAAVVGGDELAPVDLLGVVGVAPGDRVGVAIGVGFAAPAGLRVRDTVRTAPLRPKCSSHA